MKPAYYFVLIVSLLFTASSCFSQKMMRTVGDAHKLEQNKQRFIGKPLDSLLNQVAPEIKLAYGEGNRADNAPGFFVFYFVDRQGQKKYNLQNKKDMRITVFVKEHFDWNRQNVTAAEKEKWSNTDKKKYGNLTVTNIRVSGEE